MKLGKNISLPGIESLGLDAMEADLGDSALRREVKIYKVPQNVSDDKYYVSATEAGGVEEVPPSRSRDNLLLARYTLGADGEVSIKYLHKELKNA